MTSVPSSNSRMGESEPNSSPGPLGDHSPSTVGKETFLSLSRPTQWKSSFSSTFSCTTVLGNTFPTCEIWNDMRVKCQLSVWKFSWLRHLLLAITRKYRSIDAVISFITVKIHSNSQIYKFIKQFWMEINSIARIGKQLLEVRSIVHVLMYKHNPNLWVQ